MQKAYSRTTWENYPSDNTPLNETNLNHLEIGVDEIDNRVISLDTTKFDKTEAAGLIKSFELDTVTGIITITKYNGSVQTIDTLLEKIAVNFDFDATTQKLIIALDDGTTKEIDLSAFITQYEFLDSDTIGFTVDSAGKVKAIVKEGSILEKHLQPNYLADVKTEVAKAEASKTAAAQSETNAKASETNAKTSETNAKTSETNAASSASTATEQAINAGNSAISAENSATTAIEKAIAAQESAEAAKTSEDNAKASETNAASSAVIAAEKEAAIVNSAIEAESFAHGGTGTRTNEEIDNAKYYYQQAKSISESFSGALRPMGTVEFANLPSVSIATEGDMYNISDEFVTTSDFKEGSGLTIPAGSNIYKTTDGKWDILAGSPVTGIKGKAESTYRKGNVNITPDNIGAVATDGDASNTKVTFSQASERVIIATEESLKTMFGKIAKWLADLKTVAFTGSYNDLSNKPSIPTVGNGTITVTQNGTTKGTFTTNQSGNTTIALTDNNTTYSNMTAATSSAAGKAGLVPAPAAGAQAKFLRGDGTWQTPTDTKNTAGTTNKTATKMYLAGATSQAANPQTYSNSNVYIGTDNELYSAGKKVAHQEDIDTLNSNLSNYITVLKKQVDVSDITIDGHNFAYFNTISKMDIPDNYSILGYLKMDIWSVGHYVIPVPLGNDIRLTNIGDTSVTLSIFDIWVVLKKI